MPPDNHTDQIIDKCISTLCNGGAILYPTDTIWGIGCDATSDEAVNRVYRIKKRLDNKSLIILIDEISRLSEYVDSIPELARDLLNSVDSPLTIIYPGGKNLAENILAADGSIAIRVVQTDFCRELISRFGKPIVSTSANISGEPTPLLYRHISPEILNSVGYIVPLFQDELREVKPSTIIRLKPSGEFEILRK
jgi:L-threonylcarbamoyladenylate synthase